MYEIRSFWIFFIVSLQRKCNIIEERFAQSTRSLFGVAANKVENLPLMIETSYSKNIYSHWYNFFF